MYYLDKIQDFKNLLNRKRLRKNNFTIISSNCVGGILYHWLGLRFNSPFINLFLTNEDFIKALTNLKSFINTPLIEIKDSGYGYPVGEGLDGVKIHFVHYNNFTEANLKWIERCKRIDWNNIYVILSNWNGEEKVLKDFDNLPFENKVVFTNVKFDEYKSAYYLKSCPKVKGVERVYRACNLWGKRFIDDFDYVSWFNGKIKL